MTQEQFNIAVCDAWHYHLEFGKLIGMKWAIMEDNLRKFALKAGLSTTIFATLKTHYVMED